MRSVDANNLIDTDAARHALNGAFIHDLIRDGKLSEPITYGRDYYSRLPALSMPYHPPMFPALEALLFFSLGVSVWTARLAIALAAGFSALLFYRLLWKTHGSDGLAFAGVMTFFSMTLTQALAADVMLEIPSLVFTLAALLTLVDFDRGFRWRRSLWYAVFSAAAIWTKQSAIFLLAAPFCYVVLSGRWRLLRQRSIWLSSILLGALAAPLFLLPAAINWSGRNPGWAQFGLIGTVSHHLAHYAASMTIETGLLPAAIALICAVAALFSRRTKFWPDGLYLAWAISAGAVVLTAPPFDERYLFFVYPPLVALTYSVVARASAAFLPQGRAWIVPAALAMAWCALHLKAGPFFLRGPERAATLISQAQPRRVLFCGRSNGTFIFNLRSLDPQRRTAVIRGDKLPPETFSAAAFERFAHELGISYVVLEKHDYAMPWERLADAPLPSLVLEHRIAQLSSYPELRGELLLYRFLKPSPNPQSTLRLPSDVTGMVQEIKLP